MKDGFCIASQMSVKKKNDDNFGTHVTRLIFSFCEKLNERNCLDFCIINDAI